MLPVIAGPAGCVWRNPDMVVSPGGGRESDRHVRVAADVRGVHADEPRLVDVVVPDAREGLLQRDATLEARERRTETDVDPIAERERRLRPADVELVRPLEHPLVAIR